MNKKLLGAAAGLAAVGAGAALRRRAGDHRDFIPEVPGEDVGVRTSDGATLAARVSGKGPAVVLSHCWTGNKRTWSRVAASLLERGYSVVTYDHRGHGDSTSGADGVGIDRLGKDLKEVVEELDIKDAVLVGHSMGGMASMSFALQFPEIAERRFRSLVLVGTTGTGAGGTVGATALTAALSAPLVDQTLSSPLGPLLVRCALGKKAPRGAVHATAAEFASLKKHPRLAHLREMLGMRLFEGDARIALPTTIIVGTRDVLTPPKSSTLLRSQIEGSRLIRLRGIGHMIPYEAPEEIVAAIDAGPQRAALATA